MKRIASTGIVVTVVAMLGLSGQAAAFTPVPIPTPRTANVVVAHVSHDHLHPIARTGK
jgi:hypothetical protein